MKKPNEILKMMNPINMKRQTNKQIKLVGQAPGSLIYTGDIEDSPVEISVIRYGEDFFERQILERVEDAHQEKDNDYVSWINIEGIHDIDVIKQIGNDFNLHPLMLEDILNIEQRPKIDDFDDNIIVFLKMLYVNEGKLIVEPISIVLGPNYIISFQEKPGDVFDNVRTRLENSNGKIRKRGSDYLLYSLMDAVIDNYFLVLEYISEKLEVLEDKMLRSTDNRLLQELQHCRKQVVLIRRSIYPLREIVNKLNREEYEAISAETENFFRDLYDHTIQIIETIETFKETVSSLKDVFMTSVSNKMNEIMKVLTLIATIFIPITFVVGVYGMNFDFMPELRWKYGYVIVWGIMLLMAGSMLLYFKKKKWL
jgi:magnesium transporter